MFTVIMFYLFCKPTFSDLNGPRAVSGVEIYLLNEFNVVEEGDEGDEVGVRYNVGSTLAHLMKTITIVRNPSPNNRQFRASYESYLPGQRESSSASLGRSASDS